MQSCQIQIAGRKRIVTSLECINIRLVVLPNQLRKDRISRQPIAGFDTQDKVTSSASSASVSIDEWMNIIQSPQNMCSENNRICLFPMSIDEINEIIHQGRHSIMFWWDVLPHSNLAWPVFARICMQAGNRVKI